MSSPRFLLIDTATEQALLAWNDAGGIGGSRHSDQPRDHAALLLGWLDEWRPMGADSIDAIAFNAGPGSFTGLRVGCALAQSLAFAWQKPVLMLSSLHAIAQAVQRKNDLREGEGILAVIDARMQEVYWQAFVWQAGALHARGRPLVSAPQQCLPEDVRFACRYAAGSGADLLPADVHRAWGVEVCTSLQPEAKDWWLLAMQAWQAGEAVPAEQAAPRYVRQRVALTTAERQQQSEVS